MMSHKKKWKVFVHLPCLMFLLNAQAVGNWNSFHFFPPMQVAYHPVSTKSKEAQEAFDRGLTAIYAFNYDEAVRSFDKASQYDPNLAMAYWGMALALDENLDTVATLVHARLTSYLCDKAAGLAQQATPKEKAYIQALLLRFSEDPHADKNTLRKAYSNAMKGVAASYPDDLDAATLYTESLIDLLFWDLWSPVGKPKKGSSEIVNLLESVLKHDPFHVGANHYYIHALENSPYPQRALMSAYRLTSMDLYEWGHLLHTPSHIFMHVGYYEQAVEANQKAIAADRKYINTFGLTGKYPLKYLAHNLSYLTMAYLWQERFADALKTANELKVLLRPFKSEIHYFEYDALMSYEVYLYFHQWNEIVDLAQPPKDETIMLTYWSFAQALAYANLGEVQKAIELQAQFQKLKKNLLESEEKGSFASKKFEYADLLLHATLAKVNGDREKYIQILQKVADKQENFFDFTWPYPICQTLGAALIEAGRPGEAEAVYRLALTKAPLNGRLLFGLSQALKAQGKEDYSITRESKAALKYTSNELTLNNL